MIVSSRFPAIALLLAALVGLPAGAQQPAASQTAAPPPETPEAKAFASPEDAAAALYAAARRNDEAGLLVILGPGGRELIEWTGDAKERQAPREQFAQKYDQMHRLVKEPDETVALYVGAENWPLPIPIIEYNGAWYFDAELGKQEILYRRIGRNELEALEVCRALVDAEKEYYAAEHHYTEKFESAAGARDGLYWKTGLEAPTSPIGPVLAHADMDAGKQGNREPYHGYFYRVLLHPTAAGPARAEAPTNNGKPGADFVILAFPAEYRSSGVTSFLVEEDGKAYEKDLGHSASSLSTQEAPYPPDSSWKKVE